MKNYRKVFWALVFLSVLLMLCSCGKNQKKTKTDQKTAAQTVDGEWHITKNATCTEAGARTRILASGEEETEVLEAHGHQIVVDPAVEPTCTTEGKTEGSHCSVCGEVFVEQEVIPYSHTLKKLPAIAPTCLRAGKSEGGYCTRCGKIVIPQKKLRQPGHHYVNGVCTNCHEPLPDQAAALLFDQFNETSPANFITKKAYPGGTTLSFRALVPENASWWTVSYTTDAGDTGLYLWTEGTDKGVFMASKSGKWADYSVTLPASGNYYFYFTGAKGEWNGQPLLIDNAKIIDPAGKILATDSFDGELESGLFSVVDTNPNNAMAAVTQRVICERHTEKVIPAVKATCTEDGKTAGSYCTKCNKVLKEPQIIAATGHSYVGDHCTRCGKELENLAAAVYIDHLNEGTPANFITKKAYPGGSTVTFKAQVPLGVEKSWWVVGFTTDPKRVGLYDWTGSDRCGKPMTSTFGSWNDYSVTLPATEDDYYFYIVGAKGEWSGKALLLDEFTVTDTNGKVLDEFNFDIGLQNGMFQVTKTNDLTEQIAVTTVVLEDPCKKGHTPIVDKGYNPTCTAVGRTDGSHCAVCGAVIKEQQLIPALGHQYGEDGICIRCGAKQSDKAVAIYIDQLDENAPMNFITKQAYPGGSTVTFRALVPNGVEKSWWAVGFATDPAETGLYKWTEGAQYGKVMSSTFGAWAQYTVPLPDTDEDYYIYIVGAKGEWNGKVMLIDDFSIATGDKTVTDNFNNALAIGLFNAQELNSLNHKVAVELQEMTLENRVVSLNIDRISEAAPMSFITKDAYAGGSIINFKAFVPKGTTWWAVCYTTDPSSADLYKWNGHPEYGKYMLPETVYAAWTDYQVALPVDDKKYYIYIVGAKGEWKGKSLLIDDFSITCSGIVISDDFNGGVSANLFNADNAVAGKKK